jgi:vancomycin resistance protein VanJ
MAQRSPKRSLVLALRVLSGLYLVSLIGVALALACIGERWWLTAAGLYLPRAGFGLPLPFLVIGAVALRDGWALLAQAAAGAVLLVPLMGFAMPGPIGRTKGPSMRILSLNADSGLAGADAILAAIDRFSPDVVLLQEISIGVDHVLTKGLRTRFAAVDTRSQFVTASRFPMSDISEPRGFVLGGATHSPHFIRCVVETPLGALAVYNVHFVSPRPALNRVRGAGLRSEVASGRIFDGVAGESVIANALVRGGEMAALVERARADPLPLLIAGDTNLPGLDPLLSSLSVTFTEGFTQAGWGFGYTYPARLPWMRIDRIFASRELRFDEFAVGCHGASDHLCVTAVVDRPP